MIQKAIIGDKFPISVSLSISASSRAENVSYHISGKHYYCMSTKYLPILNSNLKWVNTFWTHSIEPKVKNFLPGA